MVIALLGEKMCRGKIMKEVMNKTNRRQLKKITIRMKVSNKKNIIFYNH